MLKLLFRVVSIILFVIFFGFALKNTQETTLHFFWGYQIGGPLVLLLLGFFVAGAVFGILAMTPMIYRHRREISRHRKTLDAIGRENEAQRNAQPPAPDTFIPN